MRNSCAQHTTGEGAHRNVHPDLDPGGCALADEVKLAHHKREEVRAHERCLGEGDLDNAGAHGGLADDVCVGNGHAVDGNRQRALEGRLGRGLVPAREASPRVRGLELRHCHVPLLAVNLPG